MRRIEMNLRPTMFVWLAGAAAFAGASTAFGQPDITVGGLKWKPVEQGIADRGPLSTSGRAMPVDMRAGTNFDELYAAGRQAKPVRRQLAEYYMRQNGGWSPSSQSPPTPPSVRVSRVLISRRARSSQSAAPAPTHDDPRPARKDRPQAAPRPTAWTARRTSRGPSPPLSRATPLSRASPTPPTRRTSRRCPRPWPHSHGIPSPSSRSGATRSIASSAWRACWTRRSKRRSDAGLMSRSASPRRPRWSRASTCPPAGSAACNSP